MIARFMSFYKPGVTSSHPKLVLLNLFQSLHPLVTYFVNIVHHQVIVINSRKVILFSQSISVQIHLNGQNGLLTIYKLKRSNFSSSIP